MISFLKTKWGQGELQEGNKVVAKRQFFILPACEVLVHFLSLILDGFILQKNSCFGTALRHCEQTALVWRRGRAAKALEAAQRPNLQLKLPVGSLWQLEVL